MIRLLVDVQKQALRRACNIYVDDFTVARAKAGELLIPIAGGRIG